MMNTTLSTVGQARSWNLIRKLGEGDAGEVFLVESFLERRQAILKRPRRSAFSSDIIRQASQIENEGKILKALGGLRGILPRKSDLPKIDIRVPELIDQSQPGTDFSDRFFIIVEKAPGLDLNQLAKLARFGVLDIDSISPEFAVFAKAVATLGVLPELILLRSIAGLLQMFETIHRYAPRENNGEKSGIVWNDVKPDHIFWDPRNAVITVIDWGNSQFLEADGFSKDRRISRNDDYKQFFQTFSTYIEETNSNLLENLPWPTASVAMLSNSEQARPVRSKLVGLLSENLSALKIARSEEANLLHKPDPISDDLELLFQYQEKILAFGENPDFSSAERFCTNLASLLIRKGALQEFTHLSQTNCVLYAEDSAKWQALSAIGEAANLESPEMQPAFIQAISNGLIDDWGSALWHLLAATADDPEPTWWDDLSSLIRQIGLGISPDLLPPFIVLKRNVLMMQAAWQKIHDRFNAQSENQIDQAFPDPTVETMLRTLREEVCERWEQTEPDPPDSDLAYADIERLIISIGEFLPEAASSLVYALEQPIAHVKLVLEAWEAMDFDSARRGLRKLLLWDPDRRRVLNADRAIVRTPRWLDKVRTGPQNEQPLLDFVTETEFTGRELRSQVGTAEWLNSILEFFTQLRKGRRLGELIAEYPDSVRLMPWIDVMELRRYIPVQPARSIQIEREITSQSIEPTTRSIKECQLGLNQDVLLAEPLDTWAPEARGSSARTFNGFVRNELGQVKQVAIKVMRPDRREYALPLFREEVQILNLMGDVPGVTPMLECGFIHLNQENTLPPDHKPISARSLEGEVQRYAPDYVSNFLTNLDSRAQQDWLPYLIMPKVDNQANLMWICDAGYTRGRFIPIEESIRIALQICDIIKVAHERSIVYRDHKLLHYYWQELYNGVFMIDWNVARYHPQGLSQSEIQFDLVQLGARALHHIFTGRVAPGALADGPNRVEEIEAAASIYRTQWTYDDQRLPLELKEILEQLLANNYNRVNRLHEDLFQVYQMLVNEENSIQT